MANRNKVITVEEAMEVILSGDTIATSGNTGCVFPEHLVAALERRFLETGTPTDLTLIHAAGQGDTKDRGLNHLAHAGLLRRVIGGHYGLAPKMVDLVLREEVEAYALSLGLISQWFRDVAAGRPGAVTTVGLKTFVDPLLGGGKLNERTTEDVIHRITLGGEECLFLPRQPIDVVLLRGTTADAEGNVTMEREAVVAECRAMAEAAKNSGGIVIVQVERLTERRTLSPREVQVPGIMVDAIVVSPPEEHKQTWTEQYNPSYSGEVVAPLGRLTPMPLDGRKIIARQAASFLRPNSIVNLGIGMPEGVASVAAEEGVLDRVTLTVELGAIGGAPAGGLSFGAAANPSAIIDQPSMFDFYDGGGLDQAFLGLAEADATGNVNVSRFGKRIPGPGGFINITQRAKEVFFLGLFRARATVAVEDGQLRIVQEGAGFKFVNQVQHVTFSGEYARERGQRVHFITERCVFGLAEDGLEITHIAPGLDLEKDVLSGMEFEPSVSSSLTTMDSAIFRTALMGLRTRELQPMEERFHYDEAGNIVFCDFEGITLDTAAQAEALGKILDEKFVSIGRRVHMVVNYDNFELATPAADAFFAISQRNIEERTESLTRYSTNAFHRRRLGRKFTERNLKQNFYGSYADARSHGILGEKA